ncbi:38870_t:CDS:2, partial [Gigaspora margarita]
NKRQVDFYKSKPNQKWYLAEFLEAIELDKHKNTIFLVQVSAGKKKTRKNIASSTNKNSIPNLAPENKAKLDF